MISIVALLASFVAFADNTSMDRPHLNAAETHELALSIVETQQCLGAVTPRDYMAIVTGEAERHIMFDIDTEEKAQKVYETERFRTSVERLTIQFSLMSENQKTRACAQAVDASKRIPF